MYCKSGNCRYSVSAIYQLACVSPLATYWPIPFWTKSIAASTDCPSNVNGYGTLWAYLSQLARARFHRYTGQPNSPRNNKLTNRAKKSRREQQPSVRDHNHHVVRSSINSARFIIYEYTSVHVIRMRNFIDTQLDTGFLKTVNTWASYVGR